jgi:hypothetical protein
MREFYNIQFSAVLQQFFSISAVKLNHENSDCSTATSIAAMK